MTVGLAAVGCYRRLPMTILLAALTYLLVYLVGTLLPFMTLPKELRQKSITPRMRKWMWLIWPVGFALNVALYLWLPTVTMVLWAVESAGQCFVCWRARRMYKSEQMASMRGQVDFYKGRIKGLLDSIDRSSPPVHGRVTAVQEDFYRTN